MKLHDRWHIYIYNRLFLLLGPSLIYPSSVSARGPRSLYVILSALLLLLSLAASYTALPSAIKARHVLAERFAALHSALHSALKS